MNNKVKKKHALNKMLLVFVLTPLIIVCGILSGGSIINQITHLEEQNKDKLLTSAKGLRNYYQEAVINKKEIKKDYTIVDSLQNDNIDLTLFINDERYITSIKDKSGKRLEGTKASEDVWEKVKNHEEVYSDDVTINDIPYYVYYVPIEDKDKNVVGMAFAGETSEKINANSRSVGIQNIIISLVFIAIAGIISSFSAKKISKPLIKLSENLHKLSKGDLSVDKNMSTNILETQILIDSTIELNDNLLNIVNKINTSSTDILNQATQITDLNTDTSASSQEITATVEELSSSSMLLANNIQDINSQIIDLSGSLDDINTNANTLSDASKTMNDNGIEALSYINKVTSDSEKSAHAVEEITTQIDYTNKAIEKINETVSFITDISSQTNLLALNASIEAARAGELGKGFSVVAEEIKQLSDQSATGANKIKDIVLEIVKQSSASVALSEDVKQLMDVQQENMNNTKEKFNILINAINDSVHQITDIKNSLNSLSTIRKNISENATDLSAISQENAASNETVNTSIQHISESLSLLTQANETMKLQSVELNKNVEFFKI